MVFSTVFGRVLFIVRWENCLLFLFFFFFNDAATTEIYTELIVGSVR